MTAVATPPQVSGAARVLLRGVSWGTYENLLADHDGCAGPRFTYDSGFLEIMTLSIEHEEPNRILASLVELILGEWEADFLRAGSHTFKRTELAKGFEPDSCFYIRHPEVVRGKRRLNLATDPPPDLVIEIEVTEPLLPRLPIFAAVGVPEIWQYDGSALHVLVLEGSAYREAVESTILPRLSAATIASFVQQGLEMTSPVWIRKVREWARAHRG